MTSLYSGPPDSGLDPTPKETIKLYPLHPCGEAERDIVGGLSPEICALLEEVESLGRPGLIQVLARNLTESPTISLPEIATEATELATPETEADLEKTIKGLFGLSAEDSDIKLVLICKSSQPHPAVNTLLPVGVFARTKSNNVSAYVNCKTLGRDSYLGRQIGEALIRQVRAESTGRVLFFDPNGAQANSEAVAIGAAWSGWRDGREYDRGVYELLSCYKRSSCAAS